MINYEFQTIIIIYKIRWKKVFIVAHMCWVFDGYTNYFFSTYNSWKPKFWMVTWLIRIRVLFFSSFFRSRFNGLLFFFLSTVVLFSCILSLFLLDFLVCLIRIVCLSIFVQALVCRVALNLVYSRHFEMSQIIKRIDQHQIHWYYVYFDVYNTDALFVQNSFMCSSFTLIVHYRVLCFDEMCFGPLCVRVCVCVCISIVQKSNWDR